jgi:hypothetical protein
MQFSANFTSINGSTDGTVEWSGVDIDTASLTVAGVDVPLTESSGTASFEFDGLTVIEFETGDAPSVEVDPFDFTEHPAWVLDLLGPHLDFFL